MVRQLSSYSDHKLFWLVGAIALLFFGLSTALYSPLPALIPFAIVSILYFVNNPKNLYFLFFFLLPFSVEIYLPNGLGTDLPSEPIMLALTALSIVLFVWRSEAIKKEHFTHPITLVLVMHLFWIAFTSIFSSNILFSIKFLLAKFWYVLPFYFLPFVLFKNFKDLRKIFTFLGTGLFVSIVYVMIRHASLGFSFDSINDAVKPIYRNHVNYGIMLVSFLPFLWFLVKSTKTKSTAKKLFGYALLMLLLLAIYLTYTRAAQLTVLLSVAVYFVVKWRLTKIAVLVSLMFGAILVSYLAVNNRYLDMAPDYNKAIEHKKFDNLVEATYKMEDISTVERFYRWVAGFYMIKEKPITGFGPATFYSQYKSHTVTSYKTYVSDNPEKSGIHNYYLMTAVEQGIPGLIIFLIFALLPIFYGEIAYHKARNVSHKNLIMACVICFVVIDIVILINDMLEADKVGPFYFLSASIIVIMSQYQGEKSKNEVDKNVI